MVQIPEAFNNYFLDLYKTRWPELLLSLQQEKQKIAVVNPFVNLAKQSHPSEIQTGLNLKILNQSKPNEIQEGLSVFYNMDFASLLPIEALMLDKNMVIADLCASPGGKSIISLFHLQGEGRWFINELSTPRFKRLKSVLWDYLPSNIMEKINTFNQDGSLWGKKFANRLDRVIVDVPCSGERYLLKNESELKLWTVKRSKNLSVRQLSLLCSGFDALNSGGRLVYSTCSINPIENDEVIRKFLKKRKGLYQELMQPHFTMGEPTEFGRIILPDQNKGYGPIYFSVIDKV